MADSAGVHIKAHDAIARALADNGVDTLFGLMGDGNMFLCDSFIKNSGGTFVAAAHEVGAALMAQGYAVASGKVGVASVTHGPGLVNTMTALVQGVKGSVPMVLVAGDTKTEVRGGLQDVPQREFAIVTGAGFEQVRSPRTAAQDVARALGRAVVERRPIVLNMPTEFDWADVEYRSIKARVPESRAVVTASEDLDEAIGVIAAAKRPMIIAGRGATSPDAKASILKLAKRIEAPLATTLKAKDLFRGEEFNLGICGVESTPVAVDTIIGTDCLVFFGASITNATTSQGSFLRGKRVIQVNLEPTEIGKNAAPDVGLVGDPGGVADLIVHWLDEAEIPSSDGYTEDLRQRISQDVYEVGPDADYDNGTVDYRHAFVELDRILPEDRLFVSDGGRLARRSWTAVRTQGPDCFIPALDFGAIGLSVSYGVGAAFAAKGRPVVVFAGDGAFMNGGLAEFNTAVRYRRDLIVVVCNDGCYGAEHIKFLRKQRDPAECRFDWPDFAPVAIALGGEGVTVRSAKDWPLAAEAIRNRRAPLLIDVKLDAARIGGEE